MGIEFDKWGAPVFYHFWTRHPSDYGSRKRIAVPADEIVHIFKPFKPKAARGMTWLATIIFRLHMLGAYEDAEVTAARFGASSMGFVTTKGDDIEGYTPPAPGEQPEIPLEPGTFPQLLPGQQVQEWSPEHPNTNYAGFVKSVLRSISAGLSMAYTTLSGDLEAVNYSSIRTGLQSERDFWRGMQAWMAENVHRVVFGGWLTMAVLTPKLNLPSMDAERWKDVQWRGRGWQAVDPYNETRANEMDVGLGLTSRTRLCAARGYEFEDVLVELAQEKDLGKKYDVFIDGVASKADAPQPSGGADDTPDDEGGQQPAATSPAKSKAARELQLLRTRELYSGPEPKEMQA
jgi:lambda family phage portal protein